MPTTPSKTRTRAGSSSTTTGVAALNRRQFINRSAGLTAAAALWSALGTRARAAAGASDAPEMPNLNIGIIALTDCSPFVIAHEKGFFKKYGINATITKGANWAAIRDSLSSGSIHATHMLTGMPIASTMGLLGSPKKPMIIPWMINRNGQAITLKSEWK
ncbi:MAG: nitrate ABC transporter substrate-binding protein, partial [Verrucomicrobiales bacterium VVV1]